MNKKIIRCLVLMLLITCTSCKASGPYKVSSYLNELAYYSGINLNHEIDNSFKALKDWGVVDDDDYHELNSALSFTLLYKTIGRLIENDNPKEYILNNNWLNYKNDNDLINEKEAINVIKKAVELINNPEIENEYYFEENNIEHPYEYFWDEGMLEIEDEYELGDIVYLEKENQYKKIVGIDNGKYYVEDPEINEVLNKLYISGSNEINLNEAEITPYESEDSKTSYCNNNYELLASKRHTFSSQGYKVAYSFNSSGIDIRISKSDKDKMNMFFDISLSNIKPSYKWRYIDGKIEEAFFKVDFKLTNEIGLSSGKYKRYYLDFKDLDSSSFLDAVKSSIKTKDDELECTIPICQIKTPIPNIPLANFNIDVVAKIYVTGRVEIALYNTGVIGFENRNGNFRVVHNVTKDADFIVGGSARAVAGINFNLEATKYRLMDIEFDGGVRAAVSSTLHLYDEEGNKTEENSEIAYSILEEVANKNKDVRVCADVSLNWIFDVQLNTSKSLLYKYGLTYKKAILDSNDQVFNNLTHLENWQFVKQCTRKNRNIIITPSSNPLSTDKISLSKYSAVVIVGNTYSIPIVSIPSAYTEEDLVFISNNEKIASVRGKTVTANSIGATKIDIKTSDNKYQASINILVSTG